jgi:nudix-type nucleoside diphosphatase (YffH/AdpP family)
MSESEFESAGQYEILASERLVEGFFTVDKMRLQHRMSTGGMSPELSWYLLRRPDAVCAVVYHTERDTLFFVRQFRLGMIDKEANPWSVELSAGVVDSGETPDAAIRREVHEELGFIVTDVRELRRIFPSPAILSERIFLYYVEVTDAQRDSDGGGTDHEHEDIEIIEVPARAVQLFVMEQGITDAKTLIGLSWFIAEKAGS